MEKKYRNDDYAYEDDNKNGVFKKILAYVIFALLLVVIILLLVKGCTKTDSNLSLEDKLLKAGKDYYLNNSSLLPDGEGFCDTVGSDKLVSKGLLDKNDFDTCESGKTYVKVCKLSNGKLHYVALLSCPTYISENLYGEFKEGTIQNLVNDSSDIKFSFQISYLVGEEELGKEETYWQDDIPYSNYKTISTTTYYRYKDKKYKWNIKENNYYPLDKTNASEVEEYYVTSPAGGYTLFSNSTANVAKYYKLVTHSEEKVYLLNNGAPAYSDTRPNGYDYNEGGVTVASRSRTNSKTGTPNKYYQCAKPGNTEYYYNSVSPCGTGLNPEYNTLVKEFYTCGTSSAAKVSQDYACPSEDGYSDWKYSSTACDSKLGQNLCQNLSSPKTFYKWFNYKTETRSYYPSNSRAAQGEKTYYATTPKNVTNLHIDYDTYSTGYKWYKTVDTTTKEYLLQSPSEGATRTNDFIYSSFSQWQAKAPETISGYRQIESKNKLVIQEIVKGDKTSWKVLNEEYTENTDKLVEELKDKKFTINTFEDILQNGDIKYTTKMYIRNKK